ncbi:hypothetical protein [Haloechinothrix sp. LS1_15]|uniref:hypothetical protein n=1 Tax=Haloechinothrix sp. LS1_15 TaxID=2652248 RepID=UPI00294634D8|nr:hypothetical protein [Haloechinothrix sp. LS1_15]MDV6014503.1 hypothetical protein [Haloechinothrix sp. LS1_15]
MSTDTGIHAPSRARLPVSSLRTDRWWVPQVLTIVGLSIFVIYATTRIFLQRDYWVAEYNYLTPFYSPCMSVACVEGSAHFGRFLPDHSLIPYAAISMPILLLFRLTCYYYRKAYYRSFWLAPPACAVPEPHERYTGETRFPLILQNLHRYFFYFAAAIVVINTYDMLLAFRTADGEFGLGLGNVILLVNVIMLWAYTLSCHSCRHVMGGRLKNFSKNPVRYWMWTKISALNTRHMEFAWISLGTLMLVDLYVMLVASGAITDLRFIG